MTYKQFPYPNDYARVKVRGRQFRKQPIMRYKMKTLGQVYYIRIYTDPLVHGVRYVVAHCDDLIFA